MSMRQSSKKTERLPAWTPSTKVPPGEADASLPDAIAVMLGISREDAVQRIEQETAGAELYLNSRYQVALRRQKPDKAPELVHLSIRRRDREAVGRERFRDFQRIKNELVGPETEAVELYPAESRLVDTANQYHLYIINEPGFRWPFGFGERLIAKESFGGARQQAFEDI